MIRQNKNPLANRIAYSQDVAILSGYQPLLPLPHMLCDSGQCVRVLVEHHLEDVEAMT